MQWLTVFVIFKSIVTHSKLWIFMILFFFIGYFPCILISEKVMIWINFLPLSLFLLIVFANCRLWCFKKVVAIEAMKTSSLITHTMNLMHLQRRLCAEADCSCWNLYSVAEARSFSLILYNLVWPVLSPGHHTAWKPDWLFMC